MKRAFKTLRANRAVNAPLAYLIRELSRIFGVRPEFFIRHLPKTGPVATRLPNGRRARMWSLGDDWVANQVFWRGWAGYEPEVSTLFWKFAKDARVTLDIGAHVGFYSILSALANPSGVVYAFEPLPATFDRLRHNLALNDLSNVRPVQKAVGSAEGTAEFFHIPGVIPCSSGLSKDFMADTPDVESMSVEVIRLDAFCRREAIRGIDLMKIDTETTEPDVLAGMGDRLAEDGPYIFCEVLPDADGEALTEALQPLGYHFYLLTDEGPVLRESVVADTVWFNYLFAPRPLTPSVS